jgi:type IX secretion system PorP/SprF family membrane protein
MYPSSSKSTAGLMKTNILIITTILLLASQIHRTEAQDFHLSQYDAAPLYLNPALTGSYFKDKIDYRIGAAYRSQWKAISGKPFSSTYLSFDMIRNRFGLGGYMLNNRAGSGGFNNLNFLLSGAYHITDPKHGPHYLSVGFQAGIMNKSFNPSKFSFDNQYSPSAQTGFDSSIPNEESFTKTSILKFDANMGVFYKFIERRNSVHPFLGFAVYHVTMPDESFSEEEKILPVKMVLHGGADIRISDQFKLTPTVLVMKQGAASEINAGVIAYYNISDTEFDILIGANYRKDDAVIIQFGVKHESHVFRISYDATTSYLSQFSGNRGGIEFSLILAGKKGFSLFGF